MRRLLIPLAAALTAVALFAALLPDDRTSDVYDMLDRDAEVAMALREVSAASDSLRRVNGIIERAEMLAHATQLPRTRSSYELTAAPDVPAGTRQAFAERLAAEGATLGSPRVPVRVHIVRVDRIFGGAYMRYVVLPHAGDACVVVVATRRNQASVRPVAGDRLIGTCGFYARYGMPGAGMQEWLETDQGRSAATDSVSAEFWSRRPRERRSPAILTAFAPLAAACAAGNEAACERTVFGAEPMGLFAMPVPLSGPTRRVLRRSAIADPQLPTVTLALLRQHLGEANFARLWASETAPAEAYPRLTGETIAVFARAALRTEVAPHSPGPLHGGLPLALGLALGAGFATWAIRSTKRARS
jgi:hypothetical protein